MAEERAAPAIAPVAPHQIPPPGKPRSGVLTGVVIGVVVVCTLYFGREVLIPITLAILLSFVLSPLMELLRRLWLPRVGLVRCPQPDLGGSFPQAFRGRGARDPSRGRDAQA